MDFARKLTPILFGIQTNVRQRYLELYEIPLFWNALDPFHTTTLALRVLLLLGVRGGQLCGAEWDMVDFKAQTWTIPIRLQKVWKTREHLAKPQVIPLPPLAMSILEQLHDRALGSKYVLSSILSRSGHIPRSSLDEALRYAFGWGKGRAESRPTVEFPKGTFIVHDLRRTMRTHLTGELKVPVHVAERCLGHSLGRIVETYDVNDYLDERRDALLRLSLLVEELVTGRNRLNR